MEGHPFYETSRGLEYLFGYCYRDDEASCEYAAVWGRDRDAERTAFEQFVDWIVARRRRHPRMHVYHYANYERSALTRLMGEHGTRETEIDDFLRQEVLVDLFRVVRQAIRASTESYSIKEIEKLYGFVRTADSPAATSPSSASRSGSRRAPTLCSRRSAPTTRRTAAPPSSCTNGSARSGHPSSRGAFLPISARPPRRRRRAMRSARRSRPSCLPAPRGEPARLLANLVDYHQPRGAAPSGGRGSGGPSSTTTSSSATGRRSAGSSGRRRRRARGTEPRHRATFPPQEHKLDGKGWSPDGDRPAFRIASTTRGRRAAARSITRRTSRFRARSHPARRSRTGFIREALLRFVACLCGR